MNWSRLPSFDLLYFNTKIIIQFIYIQK